MTHGRGALRAALLWLVLPAAVMAQSSPERLGLDPFRDQLLATHDTTTLDTMVHALRDSIDHHRDDAMLMMRLGFVQLRLGELRQDEAPFADAESTFGTVIDAHPGWPLAFEGRGLARLNLARDQSTVAHDLGFLAGSDHVRDAAQDLARSATLDSTCVDGLLKAVNLAAADHDPARGRAALEALRSVSRAPVASLPAVELARARAELNRGDLDSAIAVARRLLQIEPDNAAALMVLGHAQMAHGITAGAELWFRGLALADSTLLEVYRKDLQLVFPDSARRQFDRLSGQARATYVRHFFELDDPQQIRSADERIREHYRRLDTVRVVFELPGRSYLADAATPYDPDRHGLDERGLVWLLHGDPDNRTRVSATGIPPNESWEYARSDGGEFLFHFVVTDHVRGYHRVASLLDILALTTAARVSGQTDMRARTMRGEAIETYGAGWTAQTAEELLSSAQDISPTYAHMYARGKDSTAALQAHERAVGDSSIAHGETWALHYELPLHAWVEPVAVGQDAAGPMLQVAFAISGASLYAPPSSGAVVYPVRMRVSVIGDSGLVARVDTLRRFVAAQPVPIGGTLLGTLPVHVPPGTYTVRVALETASRGMVAPPDTVVVAALGAGPIQISGIALGLRNEVHWVSPSGDSIWLNPARAFASRQPMQLYFEVGPLSPGSPYHVDITVLRASDDRQELRIGFDETAATPVDRFRRNVDLSRFHPGDYRLQVAVTTPSGARAVRQQAFTIVR